MKKQTIWKDLSLLSVFLGLLFFSFLGSRPLSNPDEGRYVEIPREMVENGDWVTPRLNGLKYFEKPPLVYWVEALSVKLFGVNEYSLRFPIAIFGLIGCLAVYLFGRHFYSRYTGICSSIVLGTSLLYFSLSRLIILDMVLTVLFSGGLFALLAAAKTSQTEPLKRRCLAYLATIGIGLAFLTKGLVSIALSGAIVLLWALLTQDFKKLKPFYLPTQLFLFGCITLPWIILVCLKNPEFFDFYFIHEHFERYFTTVHRRNQPLWFFLPILGIGFFPWIVYLPKAIKDSFPNKLTQLKLYDVEVFLGIWVVITFVLFTFSKSKLIPYILPIFPPLSIFVGRYISYVWKNKISIKIESFISGALILAIVGVFYYGESIHIIAPDLLKELMPLKFMLLTFGMGLIILSFTHYTRAILITTLVNQIGLLLIMNYSAHLIQKPSLKPIAEKIKILYDRDVEVISYGKYYQDLPAYLGKTIRVSAWSGELDFGHSLEPNRKIFLTHEEMQKLWSEKKSVCVVTTQEMYQGLKEELRPFPQEIHMIQDNNSPSLSIILACNQS